jgi:Flp pilus assembly pilin Flp
MTFFSDYVDLLKFWAKRQEGQTMAEYAVVLGVIAAVVVTTLVLLRDNIVTALTSVANAI